MVGNELLNLIVGDSCDKGKKFWDMVKKFKDGFKVILFGGIIGLVKFVYMVFRI